MKKIFILAVSLFSFTAMFAQPHGRDWNNSSRGYNNQHSSYDNVSSKERDKQIKEITRDFDKQVKFVRKDRRMNVYEKQRQVALLERQRDYRINQVLQVYAQQSHDRYNDRYDNRTAGNYPSRW